MNDTEQQKTPEMVQRELSIDLLAAGDRVAITTLGLTVAEALKAWGAATVMLDAFGRVRLMAPEKVRILVPPRLTDEELDGLSEEDAIRALGFQGDSDEQIGQYLHERTTRKAGDLNGSSL